MAYRNPLAGRFCSRRKSGIPADQQSSVVPQSKQAWPTDPILEVAATFHGSCTMALSLQCGRERDEPEDEVVLLYAPWFDECTAQASYRASPVPSPHRYRLSISRRRSTEACMPRPRICCRAESMMLRKFLCSRSVSINDATLFSKGWQFFAAWRYIPGTLYSK
jgi:hypothetical protein